VFARNRLAIAACACIIGLAGVGQAAGASHDDGTHLSKRAQHELKFLDRPAKRFHAAIRDWLREHDRPAQKTEGVVPPEAFGVSTATLDAIASCESRGNPAAISSGGAYRGKYQFDYGTWASVGGSGDPAAAPEAEQDMRAAMLYARSGSSPWPICGV
jgi:hypothetical protein